MQVRLSDCCTKIVTVEEQAPIEREYDLVFLREQRDTLAAELAKVEVLITEAIRLLDERATETMAALNATISETGIPEVGNISDTIETTTVHSGIIEP